MALIYNIKEIMKDSIIKKGTTFSDYVDINNQKGTYQNFLRAYQQKDKPCRNCGELILKDKVAGRGTYYCQSCQK